MRIAKSWGEAQENRQQEIVLLVPRTWTWLWRVGAMMMLLGLWTTQYGSADPTVGEMGFWLMMAGLFGPFLIQIVKTWRAMLFGSDNQQPGTQ